MHDKGSLCSAGGTRWPVTSGHVTTLPLALGVRGWGIRKEVDARGSPECHRSRRLCSTAGNDGARRRSRAEREGRVFCDDGNYANVGPPRHCLRNARNSGGRRGLFIVFTVRKWRGSSVGRKGCRQCKTRQNEIGGRGGGGGLLPSLPACPTFDRGSFVWRVGLELAMVGGAGDLVFGRLGTVSLVYTLPRGGGVCLVVVLGVAVLLAARVRTRQGESG